MAAQCPELPDRIAAVVDSARRLGARPGVGAVALVGSWARGAGRPSSDVDLVVLTAHPSALLDSSEWFALFGPQTELIRAGDFGAIQERRLRLPDGLVVEVGIGAPSWASVDPIDAGTRRVVENGIVALCDRTGVLAPLIAQVRETTECQPGELLQRTGESAGAGRADTVAR